MSVFDTSYTTVSPPESSTSGFKFVATALPPPKDCFYLWWREGKTLPLEGLIHFTFKSICSIHKFSFCKSETGKDQHCIVAFWYRMQLSTLIHASYCNALCIFKNDSAANLVYMTTRVVKMTILIGSFYYVMTQQRLLEGSELSCSDLSTLWMSC